MDGKMQKSGLIEIILLICTSAIWGQYPVFGEGRMVRGWEQVRIQEKKGGILFLHIIFDFFTFEHCEYITCSDLINQLI